MSTKFENKFLAKSISKMYLDAESCDVKFKFDGDIDGETQFVPAHKAILGSESSVFYAMFFGPLKEGETIEITDACAEAFKEFIQFFYLTDVTVNMENIPEVIRLADKYDMLDHLNVFIAHINTLLTDDNIFWGYQLAIELDNQQLKQFCERKLLLASSKIFKSSAFIQSGQQVLKHVLQLDLMYINEIDVFNACVTWAKASCQENGLDENDSSNWKKQLGDCFHLIRFGAIAKADINAMISNERYTDLFDRNELIDIVRITTDENYKSALFNQNFRTSAFLNKLTGQNIVTMPQDFDNLKIAAEADMASVISFATTVFQKVMDEPNFSSAYAQLCRKLSQPAEEQDVWRSQAETVQAVFKKELLNKCQDEFDTHIADANSMCDKLQPMQQALDETTDNDRKLELTKQLREEERKLRHRSIGTVCFIGELYRQNMILTRVLEWCVVTLLKIGTDEKLEYLCELLKIVGKKMERKINDKDYDKKYYRDLTIYFESMEQIASDLIQTNKISSRVRSMLMDVIELRKNKWAPRQ